MPLKELLDEYARIRMKEQATLELRRRQAEERNPAFAALSRQRSEAVQGINADMQRGVTSSAAAARAQAALLALEEKERKLLESEGLPPDTLTLHVRCPHCADTGYTGMPHRQLCDCVKKLLMQEQRASSQVNERETFELFDENVFPSEAQRSQMRKAKNFIEKFTDTLPKTEKHNLILLGSAGLGKTFLLNCIAYRALSRGISIKKVTAYSMLDELLAGIRANTDAAAPYLSVPLLLIDDLGTEPMLNNITREYLFSILNERRNGRRHTVIATNLTNDTLQERYGERVFSRLVSADDSFLLQLKGDNLRLAKRNEGG